MVRRTLIAAAATVASFTMAAGMTAPSAGAVASVRPKVGPNQAFVGLVNGNTGLRTHAQIRVACPGPIHTGETTHPLAHQTLAVSLPAAINTHAGNTGAHGMYISAFMGIPPSGSTAGAGGLPTFRRYGVRKPIPTTIDVPCFGSGFITFIPFPRDPGSARAFVVPVDFVNIAA